MGLDRLARQVEKEGRDLRVLEAVLEHAPIGIVRIARETDVPEHKVRYSLRMLENDDLIEPTAQGARPADGAGERLERINDGIVGLVERMERIQGSFDEVFGE